MFVALWFLVCGSIVAVGITFSVLTIRHHMKIDKLKAQQKN